ncbi:unnamed protein product [Somion occarium]|uniref:Uncharacterized protein n=1 Tax=Somion occarium TaxID=3059160 RepID=A0ABP1E6Y7_9APHY
MLEDGCLAVAMVQRQVVLVQAARSHTRRDSLLDVHIFIPFGPRSFLISPVPQARISPRDLLTIFVAQDLMAKPTQGLVELSTKAYAEFVELSGMMQRKYEKIFSLWSAAAGGSGSRH